jgi:hypothetical protein
MAGIRVRRTRCLEKDSCYLLGNEMGLLPARFLGHGGIVAKAGTYAYHEGLIADAPDHFLRTHFLFELDAAHDCLVADGRHGRGLLWGALRKVSGKLFGDVAHAGDGDAHLTDRCALLAGKFASAIAGILHSHGREHGTTQDTSRRGFIDPGAFCLSHARSGRKQEGAENEMHNSHR